MGDGSSRHADAALSDIRSFDVAPDDTEMGMGGKILVVEDDPATGEFIERGLREAGHVVERVTDGRDGVFHATDGTFDAVVLDRMLPGLNGMAVLAALRASDSEVPVLLLSNLASVEDRVGGLTAGADDYLTKPFAMSELVARVSSLLRRRVGPGAAETRLSCGSLTVDLLTRDVMRGSRHIDVQPQEYRLLEYLMRHQDQVVTRTMLLEGVWNYHFDPRTNIVDVHISRLRRKIDGEGEPPLIHTVRGVGYRLSARQV